MDVFVERTWTCSRRALEQALADTQITESQKHR